MKNLVISRKGFDASAGGRASPIFANGDIFSVRIPQKRESPSRYRELQFNDISGREILNLIGAKSISVNDLHHNDPLLSGDKGIFGQAGGSKGELDSCDIRQGDLFFGWFKQYHQSGPNLHHLFGRLKIEKIAFILLSAIASALAISSSFCSSSLVDFALCKFSTL